MTDVAPRVTRSGTQGVVHGIVPLDKPAGLTSFQAVQEIRRRFNIRRAGHAGTLDPAATGLLPICVGQATRLVDYFHSQPKTYHCVVRLGERSDTLDLEGTVQPAGDASALDAGAVRDALRAFVGEISQVPPMHSAVRHDGRHLYEIARGGGEVERESRTVTIYRAELVALRPGRVAEAELTVTSGKGAYMRVLAADLGERLGCGGLLGWLERTRYGSLELRDAISLERLNAMEDPTAAVLPPETAVAYLPAVHLPPQLVTRVRQGQHVWLAKLPEPRPQGTCRAHATTGELVAIGRLVGNLFSPLKVMAY